MFLLLGLGGASTSSSETAEALNPLVPGQAVNLNGGHGNVTGTVIDTDGDGIPDGILIAGSNPSGDSPNMILIDSNGDGVWDGVDVDGDGQIDYYISYAEDGSIRLTTAPNGGGSPVVVIPGQGFDTNGDGIADNPILSLLSGDTTPPIASISPAAGVYPNAQNLTIQCSDNVASGHILYTINGTVPGFVPIVGNLRNPPSASLSIGGGGNGTYTVRYLCRDLAGNVGSIQTEVYEIDDHVPGVTASLSSSYVSNSSGAIQTSQLTWSSDKTGTYQIKKGGTDCWDGNLISSGNITASVSNTSTTIAANTLTLGNNTIRICVTNPNNGYIGSHSLVLVRDDTAPNVTVSPAGGTYAILVSASLTCSDAGGAGCDRIVYSSQTGTPPSDPNLSGVNGNILSGSLYTGSIPTTDGATSFIKYIARDRAGNLSSVSSVSYVVDTVVPVPLELSLQGGGTEVLAQWAPVPGATEYRIYYGTISPVTLSHANVSGITTNYHKLTGLSPNTTYYVKVEARNDVGGVSPLSAEQPVLTASNPPGTASLGLHVDISSGQGAESGTAPYILINPSTRKLLAVVNNGANGRRPGLFICDLDGSNCFYRDISAGQGENSGYVPFALIDSLSGKLLVVTANSSVSSMKPSLFRCDLDGTNCSHHDISAGQGSGSGYRPSAVIDTLNRKLLVAAANMGNSGKIGLYRCNLDGSNCTHTEISNGNNTGLNPNMKIDMVNKQIFIVSANLAAAFRPSLFRCNLDGSNCSHSDISAGQGDSSGNSPFLELDLLSHKVLVVTTNLASGGNGNGKPGLFRCDWNGTNCTYTDISSGQGANSGVDPRLIVDSLSGKLLVITTNQANQSKPALFRCNLDGTNCTYSDLSSGQGNSSGNEPGAVIDPISGKLLVVTKNGTNQSKPSLFIW